MVHFWMLFLICVYSITNLTCNGSGPSRIKDCVSSEACPSDSGFYTLICIEMCICTSILILNCLPIVINKNISQCSQVAFNKPQLPMRDGHTNNLLCLYLLQHLCYGFISLLLPTLPIQCHSNGLCNLDNLCSNTKTTAYYEPTHYKVWTIHVLATLTSRHIHRIWPLLEQVYWWYKINSPGTTATSLGIPPETKQFMFYMFQISKPPSFCPGWDSNS